MNTEVSVALITTAGILIAGLAYMLRKWADWKEKQMANQDAMLMKRLDHELEIEQKKSSRETVRLDRERETVQHIQANTGALQALQKSIEVHSDASVKALASLEEAFRREMGNGLAASVRSMEARVESVENSSKEKLLELEVTSAQKGAKMEAAISKIQADLEVLLER